jgi:uncharacterized HAD superfamily protein
MKIVCDVDNCILNFSKSFVQWWNRYHGDKINQSDLDDYSFHKDPDYVYKEITKFWKTPYFGNMPLLNDTAPFYFNLIADNNEMIIVTAVPEEFKDKRERNISEFHYDEIHFVPRNKADFIIKMKPDYAIEDQPDNVKKLYKGGVKVFYPDLPYTQGLKKYGTMYKNWKELYEQFV